MNDKKEENRQKKTNCKIQQAKKNIVALNNKSKRTHEVKTKIESVRICLCVRMDIWAHTVFFRLFVFVGKFDGNIK